MTDEDPTEMIEACPEHWRPNGKTNTETGGPEYVGQYDPDCIPCQAMQAALQEGTDDDFFNVVAYAGSLHCLVSGVVQRQNEAALRGVIQRQGAPMQLTIATMLGEAWDEERVAACMMSLVRMDESIAASQREVTPDDEPCEECEGSGRTSNHVTGEVECSHCEGSGGALSDDEPDGPTLVQP